MDKSEVPSCYRGWFEKGNHGGNRRKMDPKNYMEGMTYNNVNQLSSRFNVAN